MSLCNTILTNLVKIAPDATSKSIGTELVRLSEFAREIDQASFATRLLRTGKAFESRGIAKSSTWQQSPLHQDLHTILTKIRAGAEIQEAFESVAGVPLHIVHKMKPSDAEASTLPPIDWDSFASPTHPALPLPGSGIRTSAQRFSYAFHQIGRSAVGNVNNNELEQFYGISRRVRFQIRDGEFVPAEIREFPSIDIDSIIASAMGVEPKYGDLLRELVIFYAYEVYGWPIVEVKPEDAWNEALLPQLRRYSTEELITKEGGKAIKKDARLLEVVTENVPLDSALWHKKKARRDVMNAWLLKMHRGDHAAAVQHGDDLADRMMRRRLRRMPEPHAPRADRVQWMFLYWLCHYHFGAAPTSTFALCPLKPRAVQRFAEGLYSEVSDPFLDEILKVTGEFFTPEEKATLTIKLL
ncbi:MAG: hypothetical protein HY540_03420 [Deltaproteobacteria bacterium]|nr:hypothetical protein [Deltaproteobacteria bacterium]